mmetsp:Transcript_17806/g.46338  ORF Transcript_17806/g.46338 Transcript_17806/m.46338 type:complete len:224 (-) Transcript_17806:440-1111(-)
MLVDSSSLRLVSHTRLSGVTGELGSPSPSGTFASPSRGPMLACSFSIGHARLAMLPDSSDSWMADVSCRTTSSNESRCVRAPSRRPSSAMLTAAHEGRGSDVARGETPLEGDKLERRPSTWMACFRMLVKVESSSGCSWLGGACPIVEGCPDVSAAEIRHPPSGRLRVIRRCRRCHSSIAPAPAPAPSATPSSRKSAATAPPGSPHSVPGASQAAIASDPEPC